MHSDSPEKTRLSVQLYDWHASHRSPAADDTLFTPLASYFDYDIRSLSWEKTLSANSEEEPTVYFFCAPPRDIARQVVWIPMWDSARRRPNRYWRRLPRNVRIVAFSEALALRTRSAGLNTLRLQYFSDPVSLPPADWSGERVAFYWNRNGLVSPAFLHQWCAALRIDRLLFRPDLDPLVDRRAHFTLPGRFGRTRVESIPQTERREDFFRLIQPANVVLAPRSHEGIGLTFIEALARGCAVFAFDGATMNEYVQSGIDGYLFRMQTPLLRRIDIRARVKVRQWGLKVNPGKYTYFLNEHQAWNELEKLDLESLGRSARTAHARGYAEWIKSLPEYASFLAGR